MKKSPAEQINQLLRQQEPCKSPRLRIAHFLPLTWFIGSWAHWIDLPRLQTTRLRNSGEESGTTPAPHKSSGIHNIPQGFQQVGKEVHLQGFLHEARASQDITPRSHGRLVEAYSSVDFCVSTSFPRELVETKHPRAWVTTKEKKPNYGSSEASYPGPQ